MSENDRIQFENDNVVGSISLKGATIDDLTFKDYNVELNGNEKVILLSPRKLLLINKLVTFLSNQTGRDYENWAT